MTLAVGIMYRRFAPRTARAINGWCRHCHGAMEAPHRLPSRGWIHDECWRAQHALNRHWFTAASGLRLERELTFQEEMAGWSYRME